MAQQQIVLFRVSHGGVFGQKEGNNLAEINALLAQGWRVVTPNPQPVPTQALRQGGAHPGLVLEQWLRTQSF